MPTQRQILSKQKKIAKYKAALARERREHGWYHDGQGLRYVIAEYYAEIEDFKGALIYFRWFKKNFPDDVGYPNFHLIWTRTLFEQKKFKLAKLKAIETALSNLYLIPTILGVEVEDVGLNEHSNVVGLEYVKEVEKDIEYLISVDFFEWLLDVYGSPEYQEIVSKYIRLSMELDNLKDTDERSLKIKEISALEDSLVLPS